MAVDPRLVAPSTARNKDPIFDVLRRVLPESGTVLEIASGSGEHGADYAPKLPRHNWQPTDIGEDALASIAAWRKDCGAPNLLEPVVCDVTSAGAADKIPADNVTAIVCINMIHISPWVACEGLMNLAGRLLPSGGVLFLYGPYRRHGKHTAPSNESFDSWLQSQDRSWGVRDLDDVKECADGNGLTFSEYVEMPANNLSVIFRKPV